MPEKVDILGVKFNNYSLKGYQNEIIRRLDNKLSTFIVTANPEIVMAANENPVFMKLINQDADFVTADGIGIIKAANILNKPISERVTGYDLFTWLLDIANKKKNKVYFIGAKEEVIDDLGKRIQKEYPDIEIVGLKNGYFKDKLDIIARDISKTKPDMVFAALGYPKQEQLLDILRKQELPAIMMGVGGSFDVFSGHAKRAPKVWQDFHIEWVYRFLKEPSRFRRFLALPRFIEEVYRSKRGRR